MVHLWNNRGSHGLTNSAMIRLLGRWQRSRPALEFMIIEGHGVEKASQMVDAMQSSLVGAAYLALTVALATEGKLAQIVKGLLMRPSLS